MVGTVLICKSKMKETRKVFMSLYFHAMPTELKKENVLCHTLISNTSSLIDTIMSTVTFSGALEGTITGILRGRANSRGSSR